ncbi:restriction endonuclease [Micromonospora sp. STR1_7]|uniref:Restriction endonuclease n=1 Tax=Micromonospora parastrephiae TaxID=2806101 RepID=A0ABS1XMP2_9ACTN|nr:restriction endonuclease [Micromonospora parastrephiae]MBM0230530.1 restriction endonuclease [Micromonospora parastrephiae]
MYNEPSSRAMVIAPGPPDFELHSLGWRAFQDLVGVIMREVLGQSFQVFADSNDAGRDGAYWGTWHGKDSTIGDIPDGPFVVQVKHMNRRDTTLSLSHLADDLQKVSGLVAREICSTYILVTNARVTGAMDEKIRAELKHRGVVNPLVLNGRWICQSIAQSHALRMFVPRVYGLGDLSQILDQRAYEQGRNLLGYLRDDLATFVITDSYRKAVGAVRDHGFVLLLGEPAVGKSVIAATLAMTALDGWGCVTVRADSPAELVRHWNPNQPNQFFWVDDAFGAVRHEQSLTDEWARMMPKIMAAIRDGAKVVLTSRDYIYRDARRSLKEYAHPILRDNQVVVDVGQLTSTERGQILYNHIRLGDQPRFFKTAAKPFLEHAANATPFRPEAARRLGLRAFTRSLEGAPDKIRSFMERPVELLTDVFGQLSTEQRCALSLVYASKDLIFPPPPDLPSDDITHRLIKRFGISIGVLSDSLSALEDTFLRYAATPGGDPVPSWSFRHPTLREGFAALIAADANLVEIFCRGLDDRQVLTQLDCGSREARGVLVSVPERLYSEVARRIVSMEPTFEASGRDFSAYYLARGAWYSFFIERCGRAFLERYLVVDPNLTSRLLQFNPLLSASREPAVLAQLHSCGLLSEEDRVAAVEKASGFALDIPDAGWLKFPEWAVLMLPEERLDLLDEVRNELIPNLDYAVSEWQFSRPSGVDPKSHFDPLIETLGYYKDALSDHDVGLLIDNALSSIEDAIASDERERWEEPRIGRKESWWPRTSQTGAQPAGRSIFDDIDGE